MKPMGKRIDNMILKYPIAMKCAFGENPKRRYMTSRMSTRMTNAALIREALQKAALYMAKKEAAGDDVSKLPALSKIRIPDSCFKRRTSFKSPCPSGK